MTLTQKDFDQIEGLLDEKLDEKIKILPTKEEFFSKTTLSHQTVDHENRLTTLEEISFPQ